MAILEVINELISLSWVVAVLHLQAMLTIPYQALKRPRGAPPTRSPGETVKPFTRCVSGKIFRNGTHPQADALWRRSWAEIIGVTTHAIRAVVRSEDIRDPALSDGPFPWRHGVVRLRCMAEETLVALNELEAVRTHGKDISFPTTWESPPTRRLRAGCGFRS